MNEIKKQEVLKILTEIEASAMVLLNDGVKHSPSELVAELALIRYGMDTIENISKKFSREEANSADILEFKPK
jgi:hypothetical protein